MDTSLNVVILAAGQGTRMKSKRAKVLHQAGGVPLIEQVVSAARELTAPENIFVVVGHQAEQVEAVLAAHGVQPVLQAEQKGTGHALLVCRKWLAERGGDLLVLYGDCPLLSAATLRRLVDAQRQAVGGATVITACVDDPTGYGRIVRGADGSVYSIVEQKAATAEQLALHEINSGIYCFDAALLWQHLGEIGTNNPAGEYYLTDIVEILNRAGHPVRPLLLDDATEVLGINTRAELAVVDRILRERKTRELMLAGVTIEKPETVTIDASVSVGIDTIIGPFAQLLGKTTVGEDCRIGACSIVSDSRLGDGAEVAPFTVVDSSELEEGAHVGPFARLRMGAHLERDVRVGNFVEVKKSRLGANAKSQHLAYLGDSTIGKGANVGAGTITCNYDGQKKHPTVIGDGAFIGSNSTLVAPLEIGAGSYVAAGSVVTKPVPPDALAVGRAHQVVKEGWAKKRRARNANS
jgi:bifunctional UDP-N-acetylglucosamine pyrophosphorylase/glucosamine-1-phosphate N-acetyltransferase